jgi:hypothetical protein
MEPWNITIPADQQTITYIELFIDRKGEECHLRVNHQHMKSWRIPSSYQEQVEGETWSLIRSGISPQQIEKVEVLRWDGRRYPQPDTSQHQDLIWLRNGDQISGHIEQMTSTTIHIRTGKEQHLRMPLSRIREVRFAQHLSPS